jgi:SAM-dependent methyltransferase
MACHFCKPRTCCVGKILSPHISGDKFPLDAETSQKICADHLPKRHKVPRFFLVRSEAPGEVGSAELKTAYNRIHGFYDEFWVVEAGKPVRELVKRLSLTGRERVFEAGCGTGFATVLIAPRLTAPGEILAVDLSEGMLEEAHARAKAHDVQNIQFIAGDALERLEKDGPFDLIFSSWVLGYIPLAPFFSRAAQALVPKGQLAFVVHKENSPREPLDLFWEIVAEDPSVLEQRVAFDFPRDVKHLRTELRNAGLRPELLEDGKVTFSYASPEEVLEHLLKSGAGTAFYDALNPARRQALEQRFLDTLRARQGSKKKYKVIHDCIVCIARKPILSILP